MAAPLPLRRRRAAHGHGAASQRPKPLFRTRVRLAAAPRSPAASSLSSPLERLSDDTLMLMLQGCEVSDVARVGGSCRRLRTLADATLRTPHYQLSFWRACEPKAEPDPEPADEISLLEEEEEEDSIWLRDRWAALFMLERAPTTIPLLSRMLSRMRRELLELEGSPYLMLQPFPSVLGGPRRLLGWGVAGEEEDGADERIESEGRAHSAHAAERQREGHCERQNETGDCEGHADRHADRHAGRNADRHAGRHAGRHAERHAYKQCTEKHWPEAPGGSATECLNALLGCTQLYRAYAFAGPFGTDEFIASVSDHSAMCATVSFDAQGKAHVRGSQGYGEWRGDKHADAYEFDFDAQLFRLGPKVYLLQREGGSEEEGGLQQERAESTSTSVADTNLSGDACSGSACSSGACSGGACSGGACSGGACSAVEVSGGAPLNRRINLKDDTRVIGTELPIERGRSCGHVRLIARGERFTLHCCGEGAQTSLALRSGRVDGKGRARVEAQEGDLEIYWHGSLGAQAWLLRPIPKSGGNGGGINRLQGSRGAGGRGGPVRKSVPASRRGGGML